jgi:hypothetical protein
MDGHYRMDVISGMGHLRSDSVVLLVLHTVRCAMIGASTLYYRSLGITSTPENGSWIDHIVEQLLLLMIISIYYIYYIYITCMITIISKCCMCFINKRIHKLMTGMSCGFLLTKSSDLPLYYFLFFSICTIMLYK